MKTNYLKNFRGATTACGRLFLSFTAITAFAGDLQPPPVPSNLEVPNAHELFLEVHAAGTQNYVCLTRNNVPSWHFVGPQATLFVVAPSLIGEMQVQFGTHFLSPNPDENGTARPAWQSSYDTSVVWGKAAASSTDPAFVKPDSIPWLLVEVVGRRRGIPFGSIFTDTSYIQRVNTSGGVAPSTGCDSETIGAIALVPYTTDYLFYRARRNSER
jgi:hypothetical protein